MRGGMARYVGRRLLVGAVSLVVFSFAMFWMVESLIPGDFFSGFRLGMTQQQVDALREQFGVDQPIPVRWWRWLTSFFSVGLGQSTFGRGVGGQLGEVIVPTVFVFVTGLLIAYLIGQWLGRWTGWRGGLRSDAVTLGGISLSTLFPPFLGFVITTVLALRLRTWRAAVFEDTRRLLWTDVPFSENEVMATMTWTLIVGVIAAGLASRLMWAWKRRRLPMWVKTVVAVVVTVDLWAWLGVLPWAVDLMFDAGLVLVAFTILGFGEFMLIMQTGMVGQLNEDYVLTARAKGIRPHAIRDRHAARNAELAVVARLAVSVPYLMTGLVIIERSVGWPGLGSFLFNAIDSQDIPVVISVLMIVGFITLGVRLVLDILTFVLDPRIARPESATW
jgi:peptide/nickel transport system permease protein